MRIQYFVRIGLIYASYDGTTGTHVVERWDGSEPYCTCIGFATRKCCKHVKEIFGVDEIKVDDIIKGSDEVKRIPSSLDALNDLFGGEAYNSDEMFAVYGKPKIGKSLLMLQESAYFSSIGYNVLYIDTEGSANEFVRKWIPIFRERFGKGDGNIWIKRTKSLEELMKYIGYNVKVNRQKSKMEFRVEEYIENSEIDNTIKKNKIDVVILDSITAPIRIFTASQQDHPSKSDALAHIFIALQRIMENYGVVVIVINQASWNPANPYEVGAEMRGGVVVQYNCKRVIYIDRREAKDVKNYRRFWIVRAEDIPDWSRATVAKINDLGYNDVSDDELEKVFTQSEKSRIGQ